MKDQTFTYTGRVHFIGQTQTFPSGFGKRTLVLESSDPGEKWPVRAAFEFVKTKNVDGTANLNGFTKGETVTVTFAPEARENSKNPGQWFSSNRAWKIVRSTGNEAEPTDLPLTPATPAEPEPTEEVVDDMPF